MAEIFEEVFGSKLVKDNLVEQYNLDQLPSPNELQGKIILKGTEKNKRKKTLVRLIVCILLECLSPISSIEITASYNTSKTTYRNSFQSSFTKVRIRAKKGMHFNIGSGLFYVKIQPSELANSVENVFQYPSKYVSKLLSISQMMVYHVFWYRLPEEKRKKKTQNMSKKICMRLVGCVYMNTFYFDG